MIVYDNAKQIMRNAINHLHIPTYDGSNQAMHPDIIYFSNGWNYYKYWMVMTPYPFGNDRYENPSIVVSNDGKTWKVPEGLKNPLITSPVNGYNSDTDMIYNAEKDELWIYFLRYLSDEKIVKLGLMRSSNGINWSNFEYLIEWNLEKDDNGRSHTIVKQGSLLSLWYERGKGKDITWIEYRSSDDGIKWSEPTKVNILQEGYNIWHLDVIYVPEKEEYWMLYCAYPINSNLGDTILFFAKSRDRLNWRTYSVPVLKKGKVWDNTQIYRSTFLYNQKSNKIGVWYSARGTPNNWILRRLQKIPLVRRYLSRYSNLWHIGYTEQNYDVFIKKLEK